MFGRIKKGERVIGLRAVYAQGRFFRIGPPLIRGAYKGKIRGWHMVATRRGRLYLCDDVKKED